MTRLTGWVGLWHRTALCRLPAAMALGLVLAACQPSQSYERSSDGSTEYLDQLGEPAKAAARQKIVQSLMHGVEVYDLGIGDEIEILLHVDRKPTAKEYVIAPADQLRLEFLGDVDNSRTVQVRPDGRISLPLIGPVMAAGHSANALARLLQERYGKLLTEPKITVNVTETHSPLDDFIVALGSAKGRSIVEKVLPDGTIFLPRLAPLKAGGLTLGALKREIDAAYAAKGLDIFVSIVPRQLEAKAALVIGEVSKPGRIELDRPTTVLQAIAQAGGALSAGSTSAVRVFYIAGDGTPRVRQINLNEVMDDFRLEDDMTVPNNSIIYVPPTELAKTGRFLDSVFRDILRFQGFSIGGAYSIQ
jgi:polysaccharide export outer membrane protein